MPMPSNHAAPIALALLLGLGQAACKTRAPGTDDAAPAPIDTTAPAATADTMTPLGLPDTMTLPKPDTSVARPPISTSATRSQPDTPPSGAPKPSGQATGEGPKASQVEYEGWRQYNVHCARCHGQDVLGNPVAGDLLRSVRPGGPMATEENFVQVVSEGRPAKGMPPFKQIMSPEQIDAVYAYVKGRAEKRIPPGRPASPEG